jgi:hypothetical protein
MQFLTNEQSQKLTAMRIKEKLNGLLAEVWKQGKRPKE